MTFPAILDLSTLDGTNGFVLNGVDINDFSGTSVSGAGDVNGDGTDDLIIGATSADPSGTASAGRSYVVFGSGSGFAPSLDLSTLDGTNGFVLNGIAFEDFSGASISGAGDVNGDGIGDLIIGTDAADPDGKYDAGQSYVVFGRGSGFAPSLDLATLDGINGFVLNGVEAGDRAGRSVSGAGDINGDGIDDVIIGALNADPGGIAQAGQSYVVFGNANGFDPTFELSSLDGSNGFALNGIAELDRSGGSVSGAGDVNGDGIDDLIIGSDGAAPGGRNDAGQSHVVFGSNQGFAASLDLASLNGANGFSINGIDPFARAGTSVSSAGDVNGDGFDDLIIGAPETNQGNEYDFGASYVVFGGPNVGSSGSIDLASLDGTNGFVINGISAGDANGFSVSGAGDVNGDGIDDLIIGAYGADPGGRSGAGQSYVVFGAAGLGTGGTFELSALDGANGFALNGVNATQINDFSGRAVSSAGDVNNDGVDDVMVGALNADPGGRINAGESYVIFGQASAPPPPPPPPPTNGPPVAQDDAFTLDEDSVLSGDVLADNGNGVDLDPDGDPLSVSLVAGSGPAHGELVLDPDGSFTYTPDRDFRGTDGFTYTLGDGEFSDQAQVSLTVEALDDLEVGFGPGNRVVIRDEGEVVLDRRVPQNREELEFRQLELEADDGRLRFEGEGLGIFSGADRGPAARASGFDAATLRRMINGDETLEVDLEDGVERGGIARVTLEFGEVLSGGSMATRRSRSISRMASSAAASRA